MQGFNMGRYVPPEHEGVLNANQSSGKGHALGSRASKPGALTVRFELPFAIWCTTCPKPTVIGQGVRFNAEKRKVGAYYSSAIYSFTFRHTACGGTIEVRTDPANTAYVVTRGGRKRDTGEGKDGEEASLVPTGDALLALSRTREEDAAARATAFATLEKTIEDRAMLAAASARIDELEEVAEKQWEDPYARNAALRKAFRVGRKAREAQAGRDEEVRERMGLGIELLAENEEDVRRARLVDFGTAPEKDVDSREVRVLARPLFDKNDRGAGALETTDKSKSKAPRKLKSEIAASKLKDSLVSEIVGNTRMISDPFLERKGKDSNKFAAVLPGLKRKRDPQREPTPPREDKPAEKAPSLLVDYDSD